MLSVAYVLSFLGMIVLPVLLGFYLTRKFKLSWKLILAGALTFIASQVLHIPLVLWMTAAFQNGTLPAIPSAWALTFNAVVLGLLAGIFEETARYILYKFVLRKASTWNEGVLVGVGHGGVEAVITGVLVAVTVVSMMVYKNMDPASIPGMQPDQAALMQQQVAAFWSTPVYMAFMGLIERVSAVSLHLSLSVMVLYSIVAKKPLWFWAALLWHAVVDAAAVFLIQKISVVGLEAVVAVMALFSLGIMFHLRGKFPSPVEPLPEPEVLPA
ncbi:MAG: YhfC family glutamic-type intramembrane protease [Chloroflexota bacterium]